MKRERAIALTVAAVCLLLLEAVSLASVCHAQEIRYPFACRTRLYGYLPEAVWGYGGFIRVTAYEETTRVQVVDLDANVVIADSVIGMM
jgi:hypothetical protein